MAAGSTKETSVPQEWIAERLNLKSAANASQQIRRFHLVPDKDLPREVRAWKWSRNVACPFCLFALSMFEFRILALNTCTEALLTQPYQLPASTLSDP
jgi:hypothetical protein